MDQKRLGEIAIALVIEHVRSEGTSAITKGLTLMKKAGIPEAESEQFLNALAPEFLKRRSPTYFPTPIPDLGQIPTSGIGDTDDTTFRWRRGAVIERS
jgi:hypothetical protein